uniref:hypothetical protein n=1 Tax=Mesorhizobium sp. WSM4875 TaxID=3038539 RepID=UPI0024168C41|nr:hypothetical protein [Mesorhizobium sp. WSM4875]WIE94750.1 hypothetical protein P9270_029915 [Mesorhizobium sp. WSM4875]
MMAQAARNGSALVATVAGVALIGVFAYPSALRIPARTTLASPWAQRLPSRALTVHERVSDFRDNGLPVATIAEMARVERKTVYSWLDRSVTPRQEHEDRVAALHDLLQAPFSGNYKVLHRVWKSKGSDGLALRDLLTADEVNLDAARSKLTELAVTISRYARLEASKDGPAKVSRDNPAISESLVVDVG